MKVFPSNLTMQATVLLFLGVTSAQIVYGDAFSLPKLANQNSVGPENDDVQAPLTSRRTYMGILLNSFIVLSVGAPNVHAKDVIDEDQSLLSSCQTDCMYRCQQRFSQDKELMKKYATKESIEKDCLEQCNDNRQKCRDPAPARVREPVLLQARDIRGLYPRWQDEF